MNQDDMALVREFAATSSLSDLAADFFVEN
jgi:hypothetical protein